jgi:uncharacterized protein (TIGR00266 family)
MRTEIRKRPDFASLVVDLDPGDAIVAEPGAMMASSGGLTPTTNIPGGLFGAAKRMLAGESVFQVTWKAAKASSLHLAPPMPGDVVEVALDGRPVLVQRGSWMASTPGVGIEARWGGIKGLVAGEGLVLLGLTGQGTAWLASYGAIEERHVDGVWKVDTSHVVAFDESLEWGVERVGGWKATLFSSEGLVVGFRGRGRVWFQTRSAPTLAGFLHPFRRIQPKN